MKSKIIMIVILVSTGFFFSLGIEAEGQDLKDRIDQGLRYLRSQQNPDGSYGQDGRKYDVTPLILMSFATSPRNYSDLDGPFIRNAVEWLTGPENRDVTFAIPFNEDSYERVAYNFLAISTVNKIRWADWVAKCTIYLSKVETGLKQNQLNKGRCYFHNALVAHHGKPDLLFNLPDFTLESMEQHNPGWVFMAAWTLEKDCNKSNSVDLESLDDQISNHLDAYLKPVAGSDALFEKLQSDPKRYSTAHFWACAFLLSRLQERGFQHGDQVEILITLLGNYLDRLLAESEPGRLEEVAQLINALSSCSRINYMRTSTALQPTANQELVPMVESPLPLKEALNLGLNFMNRHQDDGKFGFSGFPDPGISALALSAVQRSCASLNQSPPAYVEKGLKFLVNLQKDDGGIYLYGLATYVTSAAIMAFSDAQDPVYSSAMNKAQGFLIVVQADEGEGYSLEEDHFFGGLGYGGDERPDLSNTQMSLEALRASGLDQDHEAFKKAILFLKRCQNLAEVNPTRVQVNDTEKIISGNDGGGIYYPGNSKADLEKIDEGVFVARSYGSMTYALLKSYLLAGLDREDKKVQAAVKWISANFTLEKNPGFKDIPGKDLGQQGLYYYYLTMARALDCLGVESLAGPDGNLVHWRTAIRDKILSLQRQDGSWVNHRSPRWFEGNPVLATAYALLVLDACQKR